MMSDEQVRLKLQTLTNDIDFKKKEWEANETRLLAQLNFSKESNESLKNDYDLLQEKFEAYMRTNNQINDNLKKDMEELNQKYMLCKFNLEELTQDMEGKIQSRLQEAEESEQKMRDELEKKDKELGTAKNELAALKGEITLKLTKLKVMELEMQEHKRESED